jgi:hypothetical protein
LNDPRVTYWEPAKWAAKLRATKTDDNILLLKINMGAGHGGKSGRWERLHEVAEAYGFVLSQMGERQIVRPKGARAAFLLFALVACAAGTGPAQNAARPAAVPAEVEVVRDRQGWTAAYRFHRASPVWVFARSPLARESGRSYRPESWTIETPGVRLERRGWYDVLVADGGRPVPERVRIRFTPYVQDIQTGYDAALAFTDGSVALFDQQFKAFPVDSLADAAALPIDLDAVAAAGPPTRTTFRDTRGRVLFEGRRYDTLTLEDRGTYVLFGAARPIITEAISAVFDPQLPGWLRAFLSRSTADILAGYARTLGPAPGASRW